MTETSENYFITISSSVLVQLFRIIKLYLGKQQISHYPLFSASIAICYIKIKLELLVLHHFDGPFDGKNRSIE